MKKFKIFILFIGLLIISGCSNKSNDLIGNWELDSSNTIITLENGSEIILNPELNIEKDNLSEEGTCGGSGCPSFVYSNEFENMQIYFNNLCFELIDKETLKHVKCYSDNIIGYDQWEDQTEHNIVYKKVK